MNEELKNIINHYLEIEKSFYHKCMHLAHAVKNKMNNLEEEISPEDNEILERLIKNAVRYDGNCNH